MKNRHRLLHNIAVLLSVRVVGFIVSLITLPYVTRVLGVESWGMLTLAQIILGYFGILIDWGFSLSATQKVASIRDDRDLLSKVFLSTWAAQWFLAFASIVMIIVLIIFVPFFSTHMSYFLYGVGTIVANILLPTWFFNGLERFKQVSLVQISAGISSVPMIFIFIRNPADAPLIIAISALTNFMAGILTLFWIIRRLGIIWAAPTLRQISSQLTGGGPIFLSTIWITLYTTATPAIIGVITGPVTVGYFSLADKVRQFVQSALWPILEAIFPRMSYLFASNLSQAHTLLKRSAIIISFIAALASVFLWLFAEDIVMLLGGEQFKKSIIVLKWLSPLPFLISLSIIFGKHIMLPNQLTQAFNRIICCAGILNLCMIAPLVYWKSAEGASITTLITESFVTIAMGAYLFKIFIFPRMAKNKLTGKS
jgi:O-antigen/teichoic acid export membrane protein